MKVKGVVFEDFVNYRAPALFIAMPSCTFKCDHECGRAVCQNSALVQEPDLEIEKDDLIENYINNRITEAVVFGGLEPFDSMMDLLSFVDSFRRQYEQNDPIIIYTGYTEDELLTGAYGAGPSDLMKNQYECLRQYPNIIVKFGRYRPNEESHLDKLLGVRLASPNQYARAISNESNKK